MKKTTLLDVIFATILILVALPAVVSANVIAANAQGGGLIVSASELSLGHKVSFSFSVQLDDSGNIDGQFQAFDQEDRVHVIGQPTSYPFSGIDPVGGTGWMEGACTVNGVEGYTFDLSFWDSREKVTLYTDWIVVKISDGDKNLVYEWWHELQVGSIRVSTP